MDGKVEIGSKDIYRTRTTDKHKKSMGGQDRANLRGDETGTAHVSGEADASRKHH